MLARVSSTGKVLKTLCSFHLFSEKCFLSMCTLCPALFWRCRHSPEQNTKTPALGSDKEGGR